MISVSKILLTVHISQQVVEESCCRSNKWAADVLLTVCQLAARGETPERTKAIYRRYQKVARRMPLVVVVRAGKEHHVRVVEQRL
ncbi:hypothetical protein C9J85_18415 [Haloferax sp. wsp5]|nr:hypothetical protein C9J85_18415 [Haloferax sp. wsp5]